MSVVGLNKLPEGAFQPRSVCGNRAAAAIESYSNTTKTVIRVGLSSIFSIASIAISYVLENRAAQLSSVLYRYPLMGFIAISAATLVYKVFSFSGQVKVEGELRKNLEEMFKMTLESLGRYFPKNLDELDSYQPKEAVTIGALGDKGDRFLVLKVEPAPEDQDDSQGLSRNANAGQEVWMYHEEKTGDDVKSYFKLQGDQEEWLLLTDDQRNSILQLLRGEVDKGMQLSKG